MKLLSQIVSILFHPLLIILYLLSILIAINPYMFTLTNLQEKTSFFVYTIVNTLVIPILSILIMKMLGIVNNLEMHSSKERIGPLIVLGSLYLWMFINFKGNQIVPEIFVSFILGSVLAIFISFFINNFTKLSLHMVGLGGMVIALILMKNHMDHQNIYFKVFNWFAAVLSLDFLIILTILATGITGTARLYLKAHVSKEIFIGLFIGILSQIMAYNIIF